MKVVSKISVVALALVAVSAFTTSASADCKKWDTAYSEKKVEPDQGKKTYETKCEEGVLIWCKCVDGSDAGNVYQARYDKDNNDDAHKLAMCIAAYDNAHSTDKKCPVLDDSGSDALGTLILSPKLGLHTSGY
ncbi:MAG: hypothetical protein ACK502_04940 [Alphaproteobacteria bacterium]